MDDQENESVFDQTDNDLDTSGKRFVEDEATDHSDIFADQAKKNRIALIVKSLAGVVLVGAIAFGAFYIFGPNGGQLGSSNPTMQSSQTTSPGETFSWPIKAAFDSLPKAKDGELKLIVNSDLKTIESSAGEEISTRQGIGFSSIPGVKLIKPDATCKVAKIPDFCFAGRLETSDGQSMMYFFKDAVDSQFFREASDFTLDKKKGAALMTVVFGGSKTPAVLFVLPDRSGFMASFEKAETAQAFFQAYQPDKAYQIAK